VGKSEVRFQVSTFPYFHTSSLIIHHFSFPIPYSLSTPPVSDLSCSIMAFQRALKFRS
jgi:hypothetical protein